MRLSLRVVASVVTSVALVAASGCGTSGSSMIAASPSLAGNWDFAATAKPASASQIGHLGGGLYVSSTGVITGMLHALPLAGGDTTALCYASNTAIPVTGTLTQDNTLTLTSSNFSGNTLTVHGTYVAGSGSTLPSLSNATYAISGPCGVAAQTATVTQEPVPSGTYTGTATMSPFQTSVGTTFQVPITVVFGPAPTPDPNSGFFLTSATATLAADLCSSGSVSGSITGSAYSTGSQLSITTSDPNSLTVFSGYGTSKDSTGTEYDFVSILVTNNDPKYAACNAGGSAVIKKNS